MSLSTPKHRIRNAILVVSLSILGGLLLTQCRSVTDNVFGRNIDANKASNCMNDCAKAGVAATQAENALHQANVAACNGDPACLAAEETRHDAAKNAVDAARKACQATCHDQGGGQGR